MCGIGTTLVEALHQDRRAVGVEYETRWAEIARANIDHTGPLRRGLGSVYTGDARHLDWMLPAELHGQAALVVTSPPYGPSTHGRVTTEATGVHKRHHLYGDLLDRGNLANIGHHRLLAGFTRILTLTTPYLRPGGRVVITVRPWREHAELIDLPAQIAACGRAAGLVPVERCVALLGRITEHGRVRGAGVVLPTRLHPPPTRPRPPPASDRPRGRDRPGPAVVSREFARHHRHGRTTADTIGVLEQGRRGGLSTAQTGPVDARPGTDPNP